MIRSAELKLPLEALPVEVRRAADAPAETDADRAPPPHPLDAMREALPVFGLPAFGRQIRGYDRPDAVLTGVETRTSSPLRITRGANYQSLNTRGLYPAGEGAGYAGGILSAAVDGIRVAEALGCDLLGVPAPPPDRTVHAGVTDG